MNITEFLGTRLGQGPTLRPTSPWPHPPVPAGFSPEQAVAFLTRGVRPAEPAARSAEEGDAETPSNGPPQILRILLGGRFLKLAA